MDTLPMIDSFEGKYSFLSNFYGVDVKYESVVYPTLEHAYQAAKFVDLSAREIILAQETPGKSKRKAKKLAASTPYRDGWYDIRVGIMYQLLRKKFKVAGLRQQLLQTRNSILVEGNNHGDVYWGRVDGVGVNMLGILLMILRDEIKREMGIKE